VHCPLCFPFDTFEVLDGVEQFVFFHLTFYVLADHGIVLFHTIIEFWPRGAKIPVGKIFPVSFKGRFLLVVLRSVWGFRP
jgi:hypothetical protein